MTRHAKYIDKFRWKDFDKKYWPFESEKAAFLRLQDGVSGKPKANVSCIDHRSMRRGVSAEDLTSNFRRSLWEGYRGEAKHRTGYTMLCTKDYVMVIATEAARRYELPEQLEHHIGFGWGRGKRKGNVKEWVFKEERPSKVRCYPPQSTELAVALENLAKPVEPRVVEKDQGAKTPVRAGEVECVDLELRLSQPYQDWMARNEGLGKRRALEASTWTQAGGSADAESSADAEARFAQRQRLEPAHGGHVQHYNLNFPRDEQPPGAFDWPVDEYPGHDRINVDWLEIHQKDPEDSAGVVDRETFRPHPDVPQARAEDVSALTVSEAELGVDYAACARAPPSNDIDLVLRNLIELVGKGSFN